MDIIEIIEHKRDKKKLSKEEIEYFIKGYVNNEIKDYQASSLLMAIYLNGMEKDEIANLTEAMRVSGEVWDLSCIEGIKVDKHSTGGVGDKVSLILGPMIASLGAKLAKMSGRGLGHTGGTIDKLESIPGFRVNLTKEEFINQVNNVGMAIIGQDKNIDPADKKIYALRDVTGTVSSIPLIASSIMSKKLASGADAILLDVKYGNGAFMKTIDEAKKLATTMVEIGKSLNKDVKAEVTDMNQPLGCAIGNNLEIKEVIDTLKSIQCQSCAFARAKGNKIDGTSCPDIISKCLKQSYSSKKLVPNTKFTKVTIQDIPTSNKCPECGQELIHSGGCIQCSCWYSKCN